MYLIKYDYFITIFAMLKIVPVIITFMIHYEISGLLNSKTNNIFSRKKLCKMLLNKNILFIAKKCNFSGNI